MDVTRKLQGTLIVKSLDPNPEDRANDMIQAFDAKFTIFFKGSNLLGTI